MAPRGKPKKKVRRKAPKAAPVVESSITPDEAVVVEGKGKLAEGLVRE